MAKVHPSDIPPKPDGNIIAGAPRNEEDQLKLLKMGYEPTLFRGLTGFMTFGVGFNEVAVVTSVCITLSFGLTTGGPAVVIWTFIVNFVMTICVSYAMAEIGSAYPSAGSVYHWAGQLAPGKVASPWAYACGWINFLGNAAGDASFANGFSAFLSAALIASGYEGIEPRAQVGVSLAILWLWTMLNFLRVDSIGWFNIFAALFQMFSVILIAIVVLTRASTLSSRTFMFTEYYNDTGFESKSYVGAIGIVGALFSFAGYEASAHMAEETSGGDVSAPMGIVYTSLATGVCGLILILTLLAAVTDIEAAVDGPTGVAAVDIFISAAGEDWGAALAWIVLVNYFSAGMSSVTVTGRITYALARDYGFPMSERMSYVHPWTKSPIVALTVVFILDALLMLLPLNTESGATAFLSITGLCTVGFQVSYAIPLVLKVIYNPPDFPRTKLSLGVWSRSMGIISSIWLLGTSALYFLPLSNPVNQDSMNWLVVVVAGCTLIGVINWFSNSKFTFLGPTRYAGDDVNLLGLIRNARPTPADVGELAADEEFMKSYMESAANDAATMRKKLAEQHMIPLSLRDFVEE